MLGEINLLRVKLPIMFEDGKEMYNAVLSIIRKQSPVLSKMIHDDRRYNPFSIELPNIVNVLGLEIEPFFKKLNAVEIVEEKSHLDLLNARYETKALLVQFHNTTFSRNGYDTPIPDPNHILLSLKERWNQLYPEKIDIPIPFKGENTREHTAIKFLNIHTTKYRIGDYRAYTTFYGKVGFKFYGSDEYIHQANVLFRFAEWSGVGIKRQMGMGKMRIIGDEPPNEND